MKRVAPDGPSSESPAINIPTDSKKWTNVIVQLEDPHERPDEKQAEVKPQPQKQRKLGNKSLYAVFGMRTNDSQCAQAEIYIQGVEATSSVDALNTTAEMMGQWFIFTHAIQSKHATGSVWSNRTQPPRQQVHFNGLYFDSLKVAQDHFESGQHTDAIHATSSAKFTYMYPPESVAGNLSACDLIRNILGKGDKDAHFEAWDTLPEIWEASLLPFKQKRKSIKAPEPSIYLPLENISATQSLLNYRSNVLSLTLRIWARKYHDKESTMWWQNSDIGFFVCAAKHCNRLCWMLLPRNPDAGRELLEMRHMFCGIRHCATWGRMDDTALDLIPGAISKQQIVIRHILNRDDVVNGVPIQEWQKDSLAMLDGDINSITYRDVVIDKCVALPLSRLYYVLRQHKESMYGNDYLWKRMSPTLRIAEMVGTNNLLIDSVHADAELWKTSRSFIGQEYTATSTLPSSDFFSRVYVPLNALTNPTRGESRLLGTVLNASTEDKSAHDSQVREVMTKLCDDIRVFTNCVHAFIHKADRSSDINQTDRDRLHIYTRYHMEIRMLMQRHVIGILSQQEDESKRMTTEAVVEQVRKDFNVSGVRERVLSTDEKKATLTLAESHIRDVIRRSQIRPNSSLLPGAVDVTPFSSIEQQTIESGINAMENIINVTERNETDCKWHTFQMMCQFIYGFSEELIVNEVLSLRSNLSAGMKKWLKNNKLEGGNWMDPNDEQVIRQYAKLAFVYMGWPPMPDFDGSAQPPGFSSDSSLALFHRSFHYYCSTHNNITYEQKTDSPAYATLDPKGRSSIVWDHVKHLRLQVKALDDMWTMRKTDQIRSETESEYAGRFKMLYRDVTRMGCVIAHYIREESQKLVRVNDAEFEVELLHDAFGDQCDNVAERDSWTLAFHQICEVCKQPTVSSDLNEMYEAALNRIEEGKLVNATITRLAKLTAKEVAEEIKTMCRSPLEPRVCKQLYYACCILHSRVSALRISSFNAALKQARSDLNNTRQIASDATRIMIRRAAHDHHLLESSIGGSLLHHDALIRMDNQCAEDFERFETQRQLVAHENARIQIASHATHAQIDAMGNLISPIELDLIRLRRGEQLKIPPSPPSIVNEDDKLDPRDATFLHSVKEKFWPARSVMQRILDSAIDMIRNTSSHEFLQDSSNQELRDSIVDHFGSSASIRHFPYLLPRRIAGETPDENLDTDVVEELKETPAALMDSRNLLDATIMYPRTEYCMRMIRDMIRSTPTMHTATLDRLVEASIHAIQHYQNIPGDTRKHTIGELREWFNKFQKRATRPGDQADNNRLRFPPGLTDTTDPHILFCRNTILYYATEMWYQRQMPLQATTQTTELDEDELIAEDTDPDQKNQFVDTDVLVEDEQDDGRGEDEQDDGRGEDEKDGGGGKSDQLAVIEDRTNRRVQRAKDAIIGGYLLIKECMEWAEQTGIEYSAAFTTLHMLTTASGNPETLLEPIKAQFKEFEETEALRISKELQMQWIRLWRQRIDFGHSIRFRTPFDECDLFSLYISETHLSVVQIIYAIHCITETRVKARETNDPEELLNGDDVAKARIVMCLRLLRSFKTWASVRDSMNLYIENLHDQDLTKLADELDQIASNSRDVPGTVAVRVNDALMFYGDLILKKLDPDMVKLTSIKTTFMYLSARGLPVGYLKKGARFRYKLMWGAFALSWDPIRLAKLKREWAKLKGEWSTSRPLEPEPPKLGSINVISSQAPRLNIHGFSGFYALSPAQKDPKDVINLSSVRNPNEVWGRIRDNLNCITNTANVSWEVDPDIEIEEDSEIDQVAPLHYAVLDNQGTPQTVSEFIGLLELHACRDKCIEELDGDDRLPSTLRQYESLYDHLWDPDALTTTDVDANVDPYTLPGITNKFLIYVMATEFELLVLTRSRLRQIAQETTSHFDYVFSVVDNELAVTHAALRTTEDDIKFNKKSAKLDYDELEGSEDETMSEDHKDDDMQDLETSADTESNPADWKILFCCSSPTCYSTHYNKKADTWDPYYRKRCHHCMQIFHCTSGRIASNSNMIAEENTCATCYEFSDDWSKEKDVQLEGVLDCIRNVGTHYITENNDLEVEAESEPDDLDVNPVIAEVPNPEAAARRAAANEARRVRDAQKRLMQQLKGTIHHIFAWCDMTQLDYWKAFGPIQLEAHHAHVLQPVRIEYMKHVIHDLLFNAKYPRKAYKTALTRVFTWLQYAQLRNHAWDTAIRQNGLTSTKLDIQLIEFERDTCGTVPGDWTALIANPGGSLTTDDNSPLLTVDSFMISNMERLLPYFVMSVPPQPPPIYDVVEFGVIAQILEPDTLQSQEGLQGVRRMLRAFVNQEIEREAKRTKRLLGALARKEIMACVVKLDDCRHAPYPSSGLGDQQAWKQQLAIWYSYMGWGEPSETDVVEYVRKSNLRLNPKRKLKMGPKMGPKKKPEPHEVVRKPKVDRGDKDPKPEVVRASDSDDDSEECDAVEEIIQILWRSAREPQNKKLALTVLEVCNIIAGVAGSTKDEHTYETIIKPRMIHLHDATSDDVTIDELLKESKLIPDMSILTENHQKFLRDYHPILIAAAAGAVLNQQQNTQITADYKKSTGTKGVTDVFKIAFHSFCNPNWITASKETLPQRLQFETYLKEQLGRLECANHKQSFDYRIAQILLHNCSKKSNYTDTIADTAIAEFRYQFRLAQLYFIDVLPFERPELAEAKSTPTWIIRSMRYTRYEIMHAIMSDHFRCTKTKCPCTRHNKTATLTVTQIEMGAKMDEVAFRTSNATTQARLIDFINPADLKYMFVTQASHALDFLQTECVKLAAVPTSFVQFTDITYDDIIQATWYTVSTHPERKCNKDLVSIIVREFLPYPPHADAADHDAVIINIVDACMNLLHKIYQNPKSPNKLQSVWIWQVIKFIYDFTDLACIVMAIDTDKKALRLALQNCAVELNAVIKRASDVVDYNYVSVYDRMTSGANPVIDGSRAGHMDESKSAAAKESATMDEHESIDGSEADYMDDLADLEQMIAVEEHRPTQLKANRVIWTALLTCDPTTATEQAQQLIHMAAPDITSKIEWTKALDNYHTVEFPAENVDEARIFDNDLHIKFNSLAMQMLMCTPTGNENKVTFENLLSPFVSGNPQVHQKHKLLELARRMVRNIYRFTFQRKDFIAYDWPRINDARGKVQKIYDVVEAAQHPDLTGYNDLVMAVIDCIQQAPQSQTQQPPEENKTSGAFNRKRPSTHTNQQVELAQRTYLRRFIESRRIAFCNPTAVNLAVEFFDLINLCTHLLAHGVCIRLGQADAIAEAQTELDCQDATDIQGHLQRMQQQIRQPMYNPYQRYCVDGSVFYPPEHSTSPVANMHSAFSGLTIYPNNSL